MEYGIVRARYIDTEAVPDEVKRFIDAYIDQFKFDKQFVYTGDQNNLEEYFDCAMEFIKANYKKVTLFDKIKSLLKR